jgi:outer membrane beta-barrel protein
VKLLAALAALLCASTAFAAAPEQVVVRNRLYEPSGHVELGIEASTSLINRLVSHDNFQLATAYNFSNEWAIELLAGYALSSHTDTADQIVTDPRSNANKAISSTPTIDDFAGLWQMQWNAVLGARWAPIYGKLNLLADVPVHFQFYVGAGGGVAGLSRTSVTYCLAPEVKGDTGTPVCNDPLEESRVAPVFQFGGGFKFWMGPHWALRLEGRDYFFPDAYQVAIDRASAAGGNAHAGQDVSSPGFEHVVFMSAGVSYLF